MIRTNQSTEPLVTNLVNDWLKSHELECKLNQESLNFEIDKALNEYFSRIGGSESNRPDIKLLLQDKHANYWPVLIECKSKL